MDLRQILNYDAHPELNVAPSFGPLLSDSLLIDGRAEPTERHDADNRDDCHRDEQFNQSKAE
jgi:hypothetical protein